MRYWPNPAHKTETSEAGPPVWNPDKAKCPRGMTVEERNALLAASVPVDAADPRSRRFAVRRTPAALELFDIKYGRDVDGVPEFHGHPASRIDRGALKQLRATGQIDLAEYNRLRRELPGC
ncbi:MAG TPA: hypothetical protein VH165_02525 [Kofleriaceae bacterium]|nr:hypothetical protein [Kofleriaceae bacterium]